MTPQKITRSIVFAALFLIPFFPLIVADPFFFPFITGKAFYFRILVEIAFAGWVILAFWDAKYRPKLSPLTIGVTVFTVIALLADLLGVNPLRSIWSNFERMEGWLVIVHLWAYFMAAKYMFGSGDEGKRNWHNWFLVNLGVASTVGLYSVLQLAGVLAIHQGSTRIDASLGNAAYMAVYMLFNVGIVSYLFVSLKDKWSIKPDARKIWIYWTAIIGSLIIYSLLSSSKDSSEFFTAFSTFVSAHPWSFVGGLLLTAVAMLHPYHILPFVFSYLIFQTQTRGTILGLIGAVLLTLALYAVFARGAAVKKSRIISASIIGGILILGIIFWTNRDAAFIQKSPVLNRIASISWSETQTQARAYIWPMAIAGALERPILGWGQENFNYIFNKDYNPKMYSQEQWFDRAHSVFLDWFVASGFLGLIAYLALYVLFVIALWKKSSLTVAEKSVLTGLIAGYAVHNIFVFDNLASYVSFFALLGFAGSVSGGHPVSLRTEQSSGGHIRGVKLGVKSSQASKMSVWLENKSFSNDAVEYIVAPIVLVALVAGVYFLNIRPIQANTGLISALTSCSDRAGKADPILFEKTLAIDSYMANQETREQIISCTGGIVGSSYPGPTKQAFFDLTQKAINDQITATPDDARMYILGGSFLNALNQTDKALSLLEIAYKLTPRKQSMLFQLATAYINTGSTTPAVTVLKDAYESEQSYAEAKSAYVTGLILVGKEAEAKVLAKDDPSLLETERIARAYASLKKYDKAIVIYQTLIVKDATNVQLRGQLAQVQYDAGMTWAATETLRGIANTNPEFKDQIEAAIKQMQTKK